MKRSRYLITTIVVLAFSCLAIWAMAGNYLQRQPVAVTQEEEETTDVSAPAPDELLLRELSAVYEKMSGRKWGMEGMVSILDRRDTVAVLDEISFNFQQSGDRMYYRLGNKMEMVNLDDCYVVLQHDAEKLLVSPKRELVSTPHVPFEVILKMVKDEAYTVSKSASGNMASITLARPNHISCKEYTLTYDTATLELRGIHSRMTNLNAPLDTTRDKVMDVRISQWTNEPQEKWFNKKQYLRMEGNHQEPASAYMKYQLISL